MIEFEAVYKRYFKDVYKYALSLTRDEHIAEEINTAALMSTYCSLRATTVFVTCSTE